MKRLLLPAAVAVLFAAGVGAATAVSTRTAAGGAGFVGAWTSSDRPEDVAANTNGDIWVAYPNEDAGTPRIVRYDPNGKVLANVALPLGHLPKGIAVDATGDAYVADSALNVITEYSPSGATLSSFGSSAFGESAGIAFDPGTNDIFVIDGQNGRIVEFDKSGTMLRAFGQSTLSHPEDITFLNGNVYVTDSGNDNVAEFSGTGSLVTTWGGSGEGDGQFDLPLGIATAGNDIVVSDDNNHRIQEFSSTGAFITKFGEGGAGDGEFTENYGVGADPIGNVYVADAGNTRVQRFFQGLDPCVQLSGANLTSCGTARAACLAKITNADEQSCLTALNTQEDAIRNAPTTTKKTSTPPKKVVPTCKKGQKSTNKKPCHK